MAARLLDGIPHGARPADYRHGGFRGTGQHVSFGRLEGNKEGLLLLMNCPNRARIEIDSGSRFIEGDSELLARLVDPGNKSRPERALLFHLQAWDVNCQQHIRQRFTPDKVAPELERRRHRIRQFEAANASLRR